MLDWLKQNETLLWWLGISSVVMFVGSLLLLPFLVARIPQDYFHEKKRPPSQWWGKHPVLHVIVLILRNVLGFVILLAGVAMLILPGQGILAIMLGVMLMSFPGKFRVERWLASRKGVLKAINWLRGKMKKPPLVMPEQAAMKEAPAK